MLRQGDDILDLEEEEEEEEEKEIEHIQPYSEMELLEKKEKDPNAKSADQDVLDDIKSLEPQEIKILIKLATQRLSELDKEKSEEKMILLNPCKSKAQEFVVQRGPKKPSKIEPKTHAAVLDMKATVFSIPQLHVGQVVQPSAVQKLQKKNPDLEQIRRVFSKMKSESQAWLLFKLQETVNRECEDDRVFGIELGANGNNPGFQLRDALKFEKNAAGKMINKWVNETRSIRVKHPSTRKRVQSEKDYVLTWVEFEESGNDWSLVFNLLTEWYPSCITICKVCERIGSEEDFKNHLPKSGVCGQKSKSKSKSKKKKDCWHGSKCRMETCVFKHPESRPRVINFASKGRSVVGCCDKC